MTQACSGFTKQAARIVFRGGSRFFMLLFIGIVLPSERVDSQRSAAPPMPLSRTLTEARALGALIHANLTRG